MKTFTEVSSLVIHVGFDFYRKMPKFGMHTIQNSQHYGPIQYKHTTFEDIPETLVNPTKPHDSAHLGLLTSYGPSRSDTEVGNGRGQSVSLLQPHY